MDLCVIGWRSPRFCLHGPRLSAIAVVAGTTWCLKCGEMAIERDILQHVLSSVRRAFFSQKKNLSSLVQASQFAQIIGHEMTPIYEGLITLP